MTFYADDSMGTHPPTIRTGARIPIVVPSAPKLIAFLEDNEILYSNTAYQANRHTYPWETALVSLTHERAQRLTIIPETPAPMITTGIFSS